MTVRTIRTIPQARTPMAERAAAERVRGFFEVALGYTMDQALREAERCLQCADPSCVRGCPVAVDIPGFLRRIAERDFRGAYDVLTAANLLPAVCGRVCPQEEQCEQACTITQAVDAVAIGRLERWVGDLGLAEGWSSTDAAEPCGFRVAIVGSGPAGLACAAELALAGGAVTVYEALHAPGGVLRYGIPAFRLPRTVIDGEIAALARLGVRIECNTLVGRLFTIEQMLDELGFHAVFIATGAGHPRFMNLPGEALNGVVSANELLTRVNLMRAAEFPAHDTPLGLGRRVAVIGAGNTAMDALRVALRLGAERVACFYRRSRDECPARREELEHAEQEGVEFHWLSAPVEILGDDRGRVRGMRCRRMALGDADESGRRRPIEVAGSDYAVETDTVVYAIGTAANPIIGQTSAVALNRWGYIDTDEHLATSMAGVFAGGDIVSGAATVILAMGAGRRAARGIKRYLGLPGDAVAPPPRGLFGLDPAARNFVRLRLPSP